MSTEQKLLKEDLYDPNKNRLTFDDVTVIQCPSRMFKCVHLLSSYILGYQVMEIQTLSKLLEDLSKNSMEGSLTEELFFQPLRLDDHGNPGKKLAMLINHHASCNNNSYE